MTLEDLKQNPKRYIKGIALDLIVVLVAIAYIFYNMVKLQFQNVNPLLLLAQSVVSIICGVVIKQSLGENGFSKGYNSEFWRGEEALYNDACNSATPYMDRADNFIISEEIERRRRYRIEHLQAVRLRYDTFFDKEGNYIEHEIWRVLKKKRFLRNLKKRIPSANPVLPDEVIVLTLRQRLMLKKCVKVKIYVPNLFSEYGTSSEQDTKKEVTDRMQRTKNTTKNTVSATVIAMIGVYFLPLLSMNWAAFIASTMQVLLWVLLGILQLYKNYSYVVQDKVALLKRKKELIKKFTSGCAQNLYLTNPYDDFKQQHQAQLN